MSYGQRLRYRMTRADARQAFRLTSPYFTGRSLRSHWKFVGLGVLVMVLAVLLGRNVYSEDGRIGLVLILSLVGGWLIWAHGVRLMLKRVSFIRGWSESMWNSDVTMGVLPKGISAVGEDGDPVFIEWESIWIVSLHPRLAVLILSEDRAIAYVPFRAFASSGEMFDFYQMLKEKVEEINKVNAGQIDSEAS